MITNATAFGIPFEGWISRRDRAVETKPAVEERPVTLEEELGEVEDQASANLAA